MSSFKDMKKGSKYMVAGLAMLALFALFTVLVSVVDVRNIGLDATDIGFAGMNSAFKESFGRNSMLYYISSFTGALAFVVVALFAALGVYELVTRKSLLKVDYHILTLGILYSVTAVLYVVFDKIVINYRPVYEDGVMESSYPSTHVLLAIIIYISAIYAVNRLRLDERVRFIASVCFAGLCVITCICRLFSGVHWLTDVIGSVLLGGALVLIYVGLNIKYDGE